MLLLEDLGLLQLSKTDKKNTDLEYLNVRYAKQDLEPCLKVCYLGSLQSVELVQVVNTLQKHKNTYSLAQH